MTSPYKNTNYNYTIPKKKKENFLDAELKKSKAVPASNAYKTQNNYDMLYKGPSPHYKRGR